MTIENAKKRLLDPNQELSYSQRIAIADLLDQLQKEKEKLEEKDHTGYIAFEVKTIGTLEQISIPFAKEDDVRGFIQTMRGTMKYARANLYYSKVKIKGWQPIEE